MPARTSSTKKQARPKLAVKEPVGRPAASSRTGTPSKRFARPLQGAHGAAKSGPKPKNAGRGGVAVNDLSATPKTNRGHDTATVMDAQAVKAAKRQRFNPLRSLEPESLARSLDNFELGDLRDAALLWDAMRRRDDVLSVVIPKREAMASRRDWEVYLVENAKDEVGAKSQAADAQKEALEYFWNNVTAVNAFDRNIKGGYSQVAKYMLRCIGDRYSVQHIVWQPSAKGLTACFEFVPLYFFENRTGELQYLGPNGMGIDGTPIDALNWLVCGRELGLMEASSIAYTFKVLSYQDWVAYNEKFGIPFTLGKTSAPKGTPEWDGMMEAVAGMINGAGAVINKDAEIALLDGGKAASALPFPGLVEHCDRAMTSLWVGSDLGTMSRGGAENAGASLQAKETTKMEADDCEWLSEQLQRIDKLVLEYLFGVGTDILAYTSVNGPVERNVDEDIKVDTFLITNKVPLAKADLAERYERTMAEEGAEVAGKSATPAINSKSAKVDTDPAKQRLRESINQDLRPVYNALASVWQAEDEAAGRAALAKLDEHWEEIIDKVMDGDSGEKAIESILGAAFVQGLELGDVVADNLAVNAYDPSQARDEYGRWKASATAMRRLAEEADRLDEQVNGYDEHDPATWFLGKAEGAKAVATLEDATQSKRNLQAAEAKIKELRQRNDAAYERLKAKVRVADARLWEMSHEMDQQADAELGEHEPLFTHMGDKEKRAYYAAYKKNGLTEKSYEDWADDEEYTDRIALLQLRTATLNFQLRA